MRMLATDGAALVGQGHQARSDGLRRPPANARSPPVRQYMTARILMFTIHRPLARGGTNTMTTRKSAALTIFSFGDNLYKTLAQNAQVNLQYCIDGYDKSVLLKEDFNPVGQDQPTETGKPDQRVFLNKLVELADEGYFIDLRIFTHGRPDTIHLPNDMDLTSGVLRSELAKSKTGYGYLPIRMVYQMNCYGHSLNKTWLDLGAKVVCGARGVNFYPNQFTKFGAEWAKGDVGFAEALRLSNTESSRTVMQSLIAADALGRSNFDKCPPLKTVLGDHACAESYFDKNWGPNDTWQAGQSGKDNMSYASYMFRGGLTDLTRNNASLLNWHP